MKKVLCIDPGYSLIEAKKLFDQGNYPGHCLYGVNHLPNNLDVEFEPQHGKCGRLKSEFIHVYNYFKMKPDIVYITFCDFGFLLLILRKLHIIRKPICVLFHGYTEDINYRQNLKEKIKIFLVNFIRMIELSAADFPVFISKYAYDIAPSIRKQYIPLMPELVKTKCDDKKEGEYANQDYIISVGKTLRDYGTIYQAAKLHGDMKVRVVTNNYEEKDVDNISVINHIVSYADVLKMYKDSLAICVPAQETGGGVYGLSSLMDALAVNKPIIASKTIGLGLDIDELNIGCTYECGNPESFYEAYSYVKSNYDEILNSIHKLVAEYNIGTFGNKIGEIIMNHN